MLTTEEKNIVLGFPYAMYSPEGNKAVAEALVKTIEETPDSDDWVYEVMFAVVGKVEDQHPEVDDTAVRDQIYSAIEKVVARVWLRQIVDNLD